MLPVLLLIVMAAPVLSSPLPEKYDQDDDWLKVSFAAALQRINKADMKALDKFSKTSNETSMDKQMALLKKGAPELYAKIQAEYSAVTEPFEKMDNKTQEIVKQFVITKMMRKHRNTTMEESRLFVRASTLPQPVIDYIDEFFFDMPIHEMKMMARAFSSFSKMDKNDAKAFLGKVSAEQVQFLKDPEMKELLTKFLKTHPKYGKKLHGKEN